MRGPEVGSQGTVTVATRGADGPGEVELSVAGGTATFTAYSVALERMIIEQLPTLVQNAGASLARANVTLLNGSDGLSEVAAGLVSQALAIYEEARRGLVSRPAPPSANGGAPHAADPGDQAAAR